MRWALIVVCLPLVAGGQTIPTPMGGPIHLVAPAANPDGSTVLFAAATAPDGTAQQGTNLYLYSATKLAATLRQLTNYTGGSTLTGITGIAFAAGTAAYSVMPAGPGGAEEVHVIDMIGGADRPVANYTEGCVQPMCADCFRACLGPVHLTADGGKVLWTVARDRPFRVVNADGGGAATLPVFQGQLAPSPQRVISRAGEVAFTSAAPSGPTLAPAATNVYLTALDGSSLIQVTNFPDARMYAANAVISDDGSLIAFESNYSGSGPGSTSQIWVVRPDGTGLRQLSSGPENAANPSLSSNGSTLVFVQRGRIRSVKTASAGTPVALTELSTSVAGSPVLSSDGSRVIFTTGPQAASPAAVYATGTDSPSNPRAFESIYAPRVMTAAGVASAAGYGAVSPGSLITVYGANLGPDEMVETSGLPWPKSIEGISVLVNGQPIPLLAVTPWQINAQLPQTVPPGSASIQVVYSGGAGLPGVNVEVPRSAPAVFAYPFVRGPLYYSQAAAYHAGTAIAADLDHPAAAGETLETYGLGLGITDPVVEAGSASPASPPARAAAPPLVLIGGVNAVVAFAGLAPGAAGIYQVNAVVPSGLPPGLHTLAWAGPDGTVANASIAVK